MKSHLYLVILLLLQFRNCQEISDEVSSEDEKVVKGEKKLSDTILAILEYYKQPDPIGLPGAELPDPYPLPDTKYFSKMAIHKTNQFRLKYSYVKVDIGALKAHVNLVIDKLQAKGNYRNLIFGGPFKSDITDLNVTVDAGFHVGRDGKLEADNIDMDFNPGGVSINLENGLLSAGINLISNTFINLIKPFLLDEAKTYSKPILNEMIEKVGSDLEFPNFISPLDMVIAGLRKNFRGMNDISIDPFIIRDYNESIDPFFFSLSKTFIKGGSSFQRVGNISLIMENNTVIADFDIGTQTLEGQTKWEISTKRFLSKAGTASFSVEYVRARIFLAQPLDTRKRPQIRGLDPEVGNIQVRCNGAGTLDYAIEVIVNTLPNLLRYLIMDALELPLMSKIQQKLDKFNVEEKIHEKLPEIDKMTKNGSKLSDFIHITEDKNIRYDDDDFFNF